MFDVHDCMVDLFDELARRLTFVRGPVSIYLLFLQRFSKKTFDMVNSNL